MTYLLDTDTCIGWLRQNQPQIVARLQAQAQTDIVLCSVVVAEPLFGVERSGEKEKRVLIRMARLNASYVSKSPCVNPRFSRLEGIYT